MRRPDSKARGFGVRDRLGALAIIIAVPLCLVASFAIAADKLDIRVLYCGEPGSVREADYCSFLEQHFSKVARGDFRDFKEEQATDHDVVVFDWTETFKGKTPDFAKLAQIKGRAPKLSAEYSRPTILIGEAGGHVAKELKIKIDWLCLCLDGPAYKLNQEHQIFHRPLEVGAQTRSHSDAQGLSLPVNRSRFGRYHAGLARTDEELARDRSRASLDSLRLHGLPGRGSVRARRGDERSGYRSARPAGKFLFMGIFGGPRRYDTERTKLVCQRRRLHTRLQRPTAIRPVDLALPRERAAKCTPASHDCRGRR